MYLLLFVSCQHSRFKKDGKNTGGRRANSRCTRNRTIISDYHHHLSHSDIRIPYKRVQNVIDWNLLKCILMGPADSRFRDTELGAPLVISHFTCTWCAPHLDVYIFCSIVDLILKLFLLIFHFQDYWPTILLTSFNLSVVPFLPDTCLTSPQSIRYWLLRI